VYLVPLKNGHSVVGEGAGAELDGDVAIALVDEDVAIELLVVDVVNESLIVEVVLVVVDELDVLVVAIKGTKRVSTAR